MHSSASLATHPGRSTARTGRWGLALTLDVLLVLLFAGLGRRTHSLDAAGLLATAWPFLAGLLLGWIVWRVHSAPFAVWPRGVALWLTTVAVGMGLRLLVGEGAAPSFIVVTLCVLAAFLLGPRELVVLRRAARPRDPV
jgi:hypothetical protein